MSVILLLVVCKDYIGIVFLVIRHHVFANALFSKFLSSMISVILTYLHILSFVFLTNPLTLIGRGSRAVISDLNEAMETLQRLKKSILKADDRLPKW